MEVVEVSETIVVSTTTVVVDSLVIEVLLVGLVRSVTDSIEVLVAVVEIDLVLSIEDVVTVVSQREDNHDTFHPYLLFLLHSVLELSQCCLHLHMTWKFLASSS